MGGKRKSVGLCVPLGGRMGPKASEVAFVLVPDKHRKSWLPKPGYPAAKAFYSRYLIPPSQADKKTRRREYIRLRGVAKRNKFSMDFAIWAYEDLFGCRPDLVWIKLCDYQDKRDRNKGETDGVS